MNKFAFIIHPLELEDFHRKFSWAEKVPDSILERFTRILPPVKASHITGIKSICGKEIEGFFVGVTLTSKQMLSLPEDKVIRKIIKAGKLAEEMGAEIIGLGAFTSVVGDKGYTIAKELDIPVTTGNSYTVATAIEGTKLAANKMACDLKKSTLTVIGATGSIGRAVSLMMSNDVSKIILFARNERKLRELSSEIHDIAPCLDIVITRDIIEAVKESEIIVSASSAAETLFDPSLLLPGAIVCDVARPRDVALQVGRLREDVLVIEGGIVKVPGSVNFNFNFGYPPGTAYACMAETMMLALEGKFEDYSLGSIIEIEKVYDTIRMARKNGFRLAGLRSFERELTDEQINRIRKNAENKILASTIY
ncbi:polysaccharide biosynthesis protein [Natronospora cellulosivora (SeqCode)]